MHCLSLYETKTDAEEMCGYTILFDPLNHAQFENILPSIQKRNKTGLIQ